MGSLRWSNQDRFARRRGWAKSAAPPKSAADLPVSVDDAASVEVALDFERSGGPKRRPGGAAKGEGESAPVSTVAASLSGI